MGPRTTAPPRWYPVVAWLAVAWMLVGVAAWFADLMTTDAAVAAMSDGQRTLYEARPGWLFAVYGVAIIAGLAGAVGLVLRRAWSVPALAVSLLAVVVQFGYTLLVLDAIGHIGAAAALPFPLLILVIGVALLAVARHAMRRGWIPAARPEPGAVVAPGA
jgi:hypothetical protein